MKKWKIILAGFVAVVILGVVVSVYFVNQRNFNKLAEQGERANVLLMGLDYVEGSSRSDTMMVASLDPDSGGVKLISIPRDMYVKYPRGDFLRINAAYTRGGEKLARQVASDLLGLPIHFSVILDYEGFKELVDAIGGIEINVEKKLEYHDTAASPPLHINIEPGQQVLQGGKALGYIRYRGGGSDLVRIERQQKFLKALLKQDINLRDWKELKALIDTARKYVKTNLSMVDMYDLGKAFKEIQMEDISMVTLPGRAAMVGEKSVLQPDIVGVREIVAEQVLDVDLLTRSDVQLVVLNGEGGTWLAHNAATKLEKMGFEVVETNNADRFDYSESYIVQLNDDEKVSSLLARAVDLDTKVVAKEEFSSTIEDLKQAGTNIPEDADLIFILGKGSNKFVS